MTPPRKPRRAPAPPVMRGAYGVVALADGAEFWAAWTDAMGHAARPPDATGFARPLAASPEWSVVESLARVGLGLWAGTPIPTPGTVDAGLWLNRYAPHGHPAAVRDDGAAVLAWRALGAPRATSSTGGPFAGAPPVQPAATREAPWFVGELGLAAWPCDRAAVKAAYHRRAMETHPDRPGGSERAFRQTERAYREATAAASG